MFIVLLFIILLTLLYVKIVKTHSYWSDRGVKQRRQFYLLGDNAGPIFKRESFYEMIKNIYNDFPGERYFGMYNMTVPSLVIKDPDLIKTIAIKDFEYFVNRRPLFPLDTEQIWSKNILSLNDDEWKHMRSTLSPSFTSSKMKCIFTLICKCADVYVKHFQKSNHTSPIELKDVLTRYTNDIISTVAYGFSCDSINDKSNDFYMKGKEMSGIKFSKLLIFFAYSLCPSLCKVFGFKFFPENAAKFFENLAKDTIQFRQEKGIVRPDMIHLLMQARDNIKLAGKMKLSDEDIAAQAFIFFLGGFESVSTTLCFLGYELAINPDVQKKLQDEVDKTLKDCEGNLTYEALLNMKYMDMVVLETLRKWPSNVITDRTCTKSYTIPPVNDKEKPVHLKQGDTIVMPIYGLHHDPEHFPKPDQFDPERFNDENKGGIHPGAYIPFGIGPRNCIGSRLAMLEVKTLYFYMLANFDFVRVGKTEVPLKLSRNTFFLLAENGLWVGLKPRVL